MTAQQGIDGMWLMLKLAARNVFRNKRRTFLSGTAIGIGLAALIFSDALLLGMKDVMIRNLTSSFMGEGQIHARTFRETQDVGDTIHDLDGVVDRLKRDPRVARFSVRAMSLGMISSAADFRSIMVVGADPDNERFLSQVGDAVVKGAFFRGNNPQDIVIGEKLAGDLNAGLGDRVVVTVAQAGTGDLEQELFRVSGIFGLNSRDMDGGMAFIRLAKAQEMLGIGENAHEIALTFSDPSIPENAADPFWREYAAEGNEALGWPRLAPQIEAIFHLSQISLYVMAVILFGVVAFGIVNTLFMSIYERIFEFGVLRAIGTRPLRLGELIVLEAGALAVVSILIGMLLSYGIIRIFGSVGIDYRGIEFEGVTIRNLIYPVATVRQFILYPAWALLFTMMIGVYPAAHVAGLKPAEAMRRSL
jgi:ABC-type lipoprotein release transport system permease subunit